MLNPEQEYKGAGAPAENTPIIDLVKQGDLVSLKKEIEEMEQEAEDGVAREEIVAAMVGERDSIGQTPLHVVNRGDVSNVAIARYLLSKGANVNALDVSGNDPMLAVTEDLGNLKAIQMVKTDKISKSLQEKNDPRHTLVAPTLRSEFIQNIGVTIALMDLFIAAGANYNLRNKTGSYAFSRLCAAAKIEEIQEARSLASNISYPSFDKAFREYLRPSHAATAQQDSSSQSTGKKKGGCLVM